MIILPNAPVGLLL